MGKDIEGRPAHKLSVKATRIGQTKTRKTKLVAEQTMRQLEQVNGNGMGSKAGNIHENERGSLNVKVNENKGGRPRGSKDQEYVDAIRQAYPPDKLLELVKVGVDIAIATGSWRGVESILTFLANYSIGKPKQRVEAGSSSALSELLAGMNTSKPLLDITDENIDSHKQSDEGADSGNGSNMTGDEADNGATESVVVKNNREREEDE